MNPFYKDKKPESNPWPSLSKAIDSPDMFRFRVGDPIRKLKGYAYDGVVVSNFRNLNGEARVVAELTMPNGKGMLHIFSEDQLAVREEPCAMPAQTCQRCGHKLTRIDYWPDPATKEVCPHCMDQTLSRMRETLENLNLNLGEFGVKMGSEMM